MPVTTRADNNLNCFYFSERTGLGISWELSETILNVTIRVETKCQRLESGTLNPSPAELKIYPVFADSVDVCQCRSRSAGF